MRVLYSHRVQSHDGQSVHIEQLISAFREAGLQVSVAGPRFYEKVDFGGESRVVSVVRKLLPGACAELAELAYNVPGFLRLHRAYKDISPDFVYERYNLYYLAGMLLKRLYRVPFYLEVNSPLAEERARFGGLRLGRLARILEKIVWRSADRVFVVTGVLGQIVAAAGVPPERITVIPNGVDRDAFPSEFYVTRPDKPVTLGFVGFVRDWHGVDAVIEALAANPPDSPIQLVIVGPGCPDLRQKTEALGIGGLVHFSGLRHREDIPALIRSFDVALQPRAVAYASPLKLFEYMACSRAIVAPDQPNIREILADGETALLFDPEEPGALWRAIRRLAEDPQLRERLGRAARQEIEERDYTWQGNAARVIAAHAEDLTRRAVANAAPLLDRSAPRSPR